MRKNTFLLAILVFVCATALAQQKLIFPDDTAKFALYVDKEVVFNQKLVVVDNYSLNYKRIFVAPYRLIDGTEVCEPGSAAYKAHVAENKKNQLKVSASSVDIFLDGNGTLRTGYEITNLKGTLRQSSGTYYLYISEKPTYLGNERPTKVEGLGDYNVKVCSFNMEYYLRAAYEDDGFGPKDEAEANRQHSKLLQALEAIDADVYGLLEVQRGSTAVAYMCNALNQRYGNDVYAYVTDGTSQYGSYTKIAMIYRKDRVEPFGAYSFNNSQTKYRKSLQGFKHLVTGETFILSLNHLKSKSGASSATGSDKDQGDGQGAYNATRVAEAQSVVSAVTSYTAKYSEPDVLVMGDMNAHSQEDPLMVLKNAGYYNMLRYHLGDEAYSYSYNSQVGLLDHIWANSSMAHQISGVSIFHINADEPAFFEYQNASTCVDDMYRSSDHDAVVVGLNLGDYSHSKDLAVSATSTAALPYVVTLLDDARVAICNADGYDYLLTDISGRVLAQGTFNAAQYNYLQPSEFGCSVGFYVLRLSGENKTPMALKFYVK